MDHFLEVFDRCDRDVHYERIATRFEPMADFSHDRIEDVFRAFSEEKGTKLGVIMNGARTLLTGVAVGPSMLAVFETLGQERSITRLKSKLAWSS